MILHIIFSVILIITSPSSASAQANCTRACSDRANAVPYPFGFSYGCEIRLDCIDDKIRIGQYYVQNITSDHILVVLPTKCDRQLERIRLFNTANYALSSRNGLLLAKCNSTINNCVVPPTRVEKDFNLQRCESRVNNSNTLSCYSEDNPNEELMNFRSLEQAKCQILFSSITFDMNGRSSTSMPVSLEFETLELGWWVIGNCSCDKNASCRNVTIANQMLGYRCNCSEGYEGDGFANGEGCRKDGDTGRNSQWVIIVLGIKFTEVATPTPETEKKVNLFFAHSEQERTFGNQNQILASTSIESESQSNMSGKGVRRPASAFALDDIDSMMTAKKVKKEIGSSSMPKPTPPVTRGKSLKKKKVTDSLDPNLFADIDPTDAQKLIHKGTNILVQAYDEMTVENAEMIRQVTEMKRVHETDQLLLKEKLEDLDKSNKLLSEAKIQHAQELEDIISQTKKSAALTVYQARIKMFEEASEPGFDKTKWDVETWKKYVAELEGEDEIEKVDGSGLDKGVGEVDEGDKMVAIQDDDGKKDKA